MKKIPYGRHYIDKDDINSVKKSLTFDKITTGSLVKKFENKITKYTKSKFSLVCSSGTSALYLAIKSIKIKKNDIVVMPSINFISSYNVCKILGAKIFLADVDPISGQITPKTLQKCITENKIKKIKCVINMYLGGSAQNIKEFYVLKKKYKFYLIEDACHSFGSKYLVNKIKFNVGSCKHSDICTFSFHPLKSITTGEGGAITTNNKKIYEYIKIIRSHGIKRSKNHWQYDVIESSFNFRISDINSALGISQMTKLNSFLQKRREIIKNYISFFKKYKDFIKIPKTSYDSLSSGHLFIISINFNKFKGDKSTMISFFNKNNIYLQQHYIPIYKFRIFDSYKNYSLKNSEYYYRSSISLPVFFGFNKKLQMSFYKYFERYIKKYKKF